MSYAIKRQGDSDEYNVIEIIADKREDLDTIPIDFSQGSTCFIIDTSEVYMLNGKKEWKLI